MRTGFCPVLHHLALAAFFFLATAVVGAQRQTLQPPYLVTFIGSEDGDWGVTEIRAVKGEPLPPAPSVSMYEARFATPSAQAAAVIANGSAVWVLRGVVSNLRYTTKSESQALKEAGSPPFHREESTRAALIALSKSEEWWALAADERAAIIAESKHISVGKEYVPAVARRLHHGRDLGEPFDFVFWAEYAPEEEKRVDELCARLRATPEWNYVTREVDVRMVRLREY